MQKVERSMVAHLANLARVYLSDEELDAYAEQVGEILGHFDLLNAVETSGVEPTAQIQPLRNVLADDVARESMPRDEVLGLAPATEDGYLRVRAVLE